MVRDWVVEVDKGWVLGNMFLVIGVVKKGMFVDFIRFFNVFLVWEKVVFLLNIINGCFVLCSNEVVLLIFELFVVNFFCGFFCVYVGIYGFKLVSNLIVLFLVIFL